MDRKTPLLWVRHRIGRRGAFLAFLALLDGIYGYYLIYPPATLPIQARTFPLLPASVWGWWWVGTGVICLAGAFMRSDRVAYGFAAMLKAAWGLRFAYLWYLGVPLAWISMTVWLVFAFIILIISGWPEEIVNLPTPVGHRDR